MSTAQTSNSLVSRFSTGSKTCQRLPIGSARNPILALVRMHANQMGVRQTGGSMNSPAGTSSGRRALAAIATIVAVTLFAIGTTEASADTPAGGGR